MSDGTIIHGASDILDVSVEQPLSMEQSTAVVPTALPKLTRKQRRFVNEYLVDFNGKRAAVAAGYSSKTANAIASELLKLKPAVRSAVNAALAERAEREAIEREMLIRQIETIVYFDASRLVHPSGRIKAPHELDPATASVVESFDITEHFGKRNGKRVVTGRTVKYRLMDRNPSIDHLAEILGLIGKHRIGLTINNTQVNVANLPSDPLQASLAYQRIMNGGGSAD